MYCTKKQPFLKNMNRFCCTKGSHIVFYKIYIIAHLNVCMLEDLKSNLEQTILSSPGQSPGRAIILPPALAAASALAKSLTLGELSCPCDRSCLSFHYCEQPGPDLH